jgi:predicted RNA-binding Zn-ribbon protein involved in translation (DUF1610 family)
MGEKQYVFKPSELQTVSCECANCGTAIHLNVTSEKFGLPEACPSCNMDLKEFAKAVLNYRAFQRDAANLKLKLRTEPKTSEEI